MKTPGDSGKFCGTMIVFCHCLSCLLVAGNAKQYLHGQITKVTKRIIEKQGDGNLLILVAAVSSPAKIWCRFTTVLRFKRKWLNYSTVKATSFVSQ